MHREFHLLPANVAMSAAFLLVGVGIGAYFLIRPVGHFIAGETSFADIEGALTSLPRRSALVMAICYVPMVALRMLSRRFGIDLDAMQEDPGLARSGRLIHRRHRVQCPADLLRRQRLPRPALRASVPHPRRQPPRLPRPLPPQGLRRPAVHGLRRRDPAVGGHRKLQRRAPGARSDDGRGRHHRRHPVHGLLDQPCAQPSGRPPRPRHAAGRQGRLPGAPAGDLRRRDGPRRRPLQRDGRGPVGARVPARHVRQVRQQERRHRDPRQPRSRGPRRRHHRRGHPDVHRHRGLHRPLRAPGAGRGRGRS